MWYTFFHSYSLSELPECRVTLAKRTDIIDQILAIACGTNDDFTVNLVSVNMIMCLALSPGAHSYLVRTNVINDLLKICASREKVASEQPLGKNDDPGAFKTLL